MRARSADLSMNLCSSIHFWFGIQSECVCCCFCFCLLLCAIPDAVIIIIKQTSWMPPTFHFALLYSWCCFGVFEFFFLSLSLFCFFPSSCFVFLNHVWFAGNGSFEIQRLRWQESHTNRKYVIVPSANGNRLLFSRQNELTEQSKNTITSLARSRDFNEMWMLYECALWLLYAIGWLVGWCSPFMFVVQRRISKAVWSQLNLENNFPNYVLHSLQMHAIHKRDK